jgi:integrase
VKLTEATVARLQLDPGAKDQIFWDSDLRGFGFRVRASGVRCFVYQYKVAHKTKRMTIGQASAFKVNAARTIAAKHHAKVRQGGDPARERDELRTGIRREQEDTFASLATQFLNQYRARPNTLSEVRRHLVQYAAPFAKLPVNDIALRDVADLLAKVEQSSGSVTANRLRSSLSLLYRWAMGEGRATSNPAIGTNRRKEIPRDRVLSDNELRRIWKATGDAGLPGAFGAIVRLLLLTGQRRSEIGDLRWSEIDLQNGALNIGAERTKNKRPHCVPLSATALALLSAVPRTGEDVFGLFNCWGWAKRHLDAAADVRNWTLHDLRRTCVTGMANLDVQPHIIEAVLNHQSGAKRGVAGVYNRSPYAAEKVAALTAWDAHVKQLVTRRAA